MSPLDPAAEACLRRTRAAVLNLLVLAALGIGLGGLVLRGRADEPRSPDRAWPFVALMGLVVGSFAVRRTLGARSSLRAPSLRARRFYAAHVVAAALGLLAVPLGFAYGWVVRPTLDAVGPFWIAAMALGVLALPRPAELDGFDEPLPPESEPSPREPHP